jgi:protein TonB
MRSYSGKEFVMHNGGFFEKRGTNSLGLGIIVAGHAVLLTAIALNPTRFGPRINFIPTVDSIRAMDPPPPEPLPEPKAHPRERTVEKIDPLVKADLTTGTDVLLRPLPVDPPPVPQPQPIAEPVFRQAMMEPNAMNRFQPPYPSAMVRAGIEGSVTVRVLIGIDGRVKAIELVRASNPDFFEATKDHALRAWRFKPATKDNIATESWRTMTVRFLLES